MQCKALQREYKRLEQKHFYFGTALSFKGGVDKLESLLGFATQIFGGVDTILIISTGLGICLCFLTW